MPGPGNTINIDTIISTLDLILTITFWSVLGSLLIYFLIGLLRGWKHGTYRTVFMLIILVTLLALMPVWINIVDGLNLAQMGLGTIQFEMRGTTISVTPTTGFATIKEIVYKVLKDAYQVKASPEAIMEYAVAFTASAIRLVLVTAIALITMTVGSLLSFLLWHIAFKHFIPKEKRKAKLRVISALEETVVGALCLVLLVTPISGMVNAFHGYVDTSTIPDKNETVQLYKRVADTYEKSILNQAFFAWTRGNGKVSLDVQLAEFLAASDMGNASANVITEIRALASTGGGLLSLVASSRGASETSSLMLSPVEFVGRSVASLLSLSGNEGMKVLSNLSSFAADISSNYEEVSKALGNETIYRVASPKLKGRAYLEESKQAYNRLLNSGIIETELDPLTELNQIPVYDNPYFALTSDSTLNALEKVYSSPKEKAVVDSLLHGYLYSNIQDDGVKTIAPNLEEGDIDSFASYDYLFEAKTIVSTFNKLNKMEPTLAKKAITQVKRANSSSSGEEISTQEILNLALSAFANKSQEFIELFVGPRDSKKEPVINDKGISQNGCLFDSGLINAVFPVALEVAGTEMASSLQTSVDMSALGQVAIELQGANTKENIVNDKREFGHVLDIVGNMLTNPYASSTDEAKVKEGQAIADAAKNLLLDYKAHKGIELDPEGNLYSYDTSLMKAVASGLIEIDNSKIMTAMMPPLAESMLTSASDSLKQLGLVGINPSPTDDNGKSTLGWELGKIVAIGYRCEHVFPIFVRSGNYSIDSISRAMSNHADEFEKLLDIVSYSKILNPSFRVVNNQYVIDTKQTQSEHPTDKVVDNLNFVKLLNSLFSSFNLDEALGDDALNSSAVTMANEYQEAAFIGDYLSVKTVDHENNALIEAISTVLDSGVLDALTSMAGSSNILRNLQDAKIDTIFSAIGGSYVLKKVIPGYFDQAILEKVFNAGGGTSFDLKAYGISFKNIGDTQEAWDKEGEYFSTLISLASRGIDLSHFDLIQDGEALIEIMSALSSSKMFQPYELDEQGAIVTDEDGNYVRDYVFPSFFSDKLLASAGDDALKYFQNRDADPSAKAEERCSTFVAECKKLDTPEKWAIESNGEFKKLAKVFNDLSSFGSLDALSKINSSNLTKLRYTLHDIADTDTFSCVFIANALNDALKGISSGDLDFSSAYTTYFYDDERTGSYDRAAKANEMKGQVNELFDIMDIVFDKNYGIYDGTSVSLDGINLKTISTEYFLRPLLESTHDSVVFHPTADIIGSSAYTAFRSAHPYTVFEQMIGQIVMRSSVYSLPGSATWETPLRDNGYPSDLSIAGIITGLDSAEWNNEIDSLTNIVDQLKTSSLVDGSGNVDFSVMSNLATFFGNTEAKKEATATWLNGFLKSIDGSSLLRRALPARLQSAIDGVSLSGELGNDLKCVDFYFENPGNTDYSALGDNEIDRLVSIFKDLSGCMNMNPEDISTLDGVALSNALKEMERSAIFHSNTTKSVELFSGTPEKQNHTAFQNLMADILSNKALKSYIYYADSPKDAYYTSSGTYNNALSKAIYLIEQNTIAPINGTSVGEPNNPEIDKVGEFLNFLGSDSLSSFLSGGTPKFEDMDGDTLNQALLRLNASAFLRDIVPSALDQTVNAAAGFDIDGINLKASSFYYMYDEYVGSNNDEKYARGYDESEINQICFIMDELKQAKDSLSSFDISKVDPMQLRYLLLDLSNSKVFHLGGARRGDGIIAPTSWGYDTDKVVEANDLTVFEQFIEKVYVKSSLYKQNFDLKQSESDLKLYLSDDLSFLPNSLTIDERSDAAALYKIHNNIKLFSASQSTSTYPVAKGNPIKVSWLNEINALTSDGHHHDPKIKDYMEADELKHEQDSYVGLIEVIQETGLVSGTDVNLNASTLTLTEPNKIYYLFSALNNCTIVNEALSNSFATFVSGKGQDSGGAGISSFTSANFEVAGPVTSLSFDSETLGSTYKVGDETFTRNAMASKVSFAYDYVGKVSDEDVASHFSDHFKLTYDGKDVTALASASSEAGLIKLDVAKIPGSFAIAALDEGATFTSAIFTYDKADYRLNQDEYENKAIPSVYYFFASAFRGQAYNDSYYYSFEDSTAMGDFLNDPNCAPGFDHSTFGLFYLLNGSGIFDNIYNRDSVNEYSAKDYALYNLLEVKADVGSGVQSLKMGGEFNPVLGNDEIISSSVGIHSITKSFVTDEQVIDFCFREAAYLDEHIEEIGFADVLVNKVYWEQLYNGAMSAFVKFTLINALEMPLFADASEGQPLARMKAFASSQTYEKSITLYGTLDTGNADFTSQSPTYREPGPLVSKIMSSVVRKFGAAYNSSAKLNYSFIIAGTYPGTMKTDRKPYMTADGYADLAAYSEAFTHEMALEKVDGKLNAVSALGEIADALHYVNAKDKAGLASIVTKFDNVTGGAKILLEQFYMGDLYDHLSGGHNMVSPINVFNGSNVYYDFVGNNNILAGVTDKPFAYADVASILTA